MSRFQPISLTEMQEFLEPQGFKIIPNLPKTREIVFGKVVAPDLCLRIYTTIEPSGESRDCGSDAIRFVLVWRNPETSDVKKIGGDKKCLRVTGWRENMQKRIDRWNEMKGQDCPRCGSPMCLRNGRNGKFYGCSQYPNCKGTRQA